MVRIATAGNTENPALLVLKAKGYEVRVGLDEEGQIVSFWARQNSNVFIADSLVSLLGLVALWENRGDNWPTHDDEPDYYDQPFEERDETW